eukprot:7174158-Prymnesium_polylepis.2
MVWSCGMPAIEVEMASRSRFASANRSADADTHSAFWCPCSHASRMMAACVRPLPTPAPSARRKPFRQPDGRSGCEWHCPARTIASSCSPDSAPVLPIRRGTAG